MGPIFFELLQNNIIMKVFICLSAALALAYAEPFLSSGSAAGPLHPAVGGLVATKRGYRPIALEGYSEDDNKDGFVDPIGQVAPVAVAPVAYAAPLVHHVAPYALPTVKVEAPKVEVKAAPVVTYAAAPPVHAAHHVVTHPVTYTHTVPAGVLTHTVAGGYITGLPVVAAAAAEAPAAAEGVTEA